jgi:hypothetical protein
MLFKDATFTPAVTLEPVSDDSDYFLSLPMDITIDDEGNYYVADAMAKTIFMWDAEGTFLGNFGKAGEGPGEFRFMGMGGPQAYLSVIDGQVMVYDGGNTSVNMFDKNHEFQSTALFKMTGGRTELVKATPSGDFVVHHRRFMGENPTLNVGVFSKDGKEIRNIVEFPDESFTRKTRDGQFAGLTLHAFSHNLVVHYDRQKGHILAGYSSKPAFDVYDLEGKLIKKVQFQALEPEVTREDQEEYKEQSWIKRGLASGWLDVDFPDKKAFYTGILTVENGGYLVYNRSPHFAKIDGYILDGNGKTLNRVKMNLGENGNLYSVGGRVIAIQVDDYGDFIISELKLGGTDS